MQNPSVTKGRTQKLPKEIQIVKTYWHDHSLESSWVALSDGTITFSIQLFSGEKKKFLNFFQFTYFLGDAFSECFSKNLSP
jgi:hypothetical protein